MKVLPIGSIVKIGNNKALIVGHHQSEKDGYYVYNYILAKYPYGHSKKGALKCVPLEGIDEVLFEGYQDEKSTAYTAILEKLADNYKKVDVKTIAFFGQVLANYMKEEMEERL